MENITLMQIGEYVAFLVGLFSGIGYLSKSLKKSFKTALNEEIEPIKHTVTQNRLDNLKNFIVLVFDDIENGIEIGETTKERLYDALDSYEGLGGNSYIHKRKMRLEKEGKL